MKNKVYLNGRFLTRPLSGVQRTAYEMVKAMDDLIAQNPAHYNAITFILIYSGEILNTIELKQIKLLKRGLLTGNLWEQLELPLYTAGHLLVSMCSISTLFKRKQLLIVHDASFLVNKNFFSRGFRMWYKFAIPLIAKLSRHVITVSNFSKGELVNHGNMDADKIEVIYNAANHILRFNNPDPEFIDKINALKPYCLSVSSLGANKNFQGLSTAINKIDFANYHMLIAGGEMRTLKTVIPNTNVTYLGYVTNNELKYLYSNASLFVFPSFYEGFGIPPLEAMISGCPVVASNTSSMPEVLGDACEYFNPANPDDIAGKIDALINNPHRLSELRDKGYERAARYNWEKSGKQLYNLINQYSG